MARPDSSLSSAGPAASASAAELLLQAVNRRREESGGPALAIEPKLGAVVQAYVDELAQKNALPSAEVSQLLIGRLNDHGYHAYRVVVLFAQMEGDFDLVLESWRQRDPASFEKLLNPDLHDLALATGTVQGRPIYLAVGAVRQRDYYEAQSVDLRHDLEKVRREILRQVNEVRSEARVGGLVRHPSLDQVAQSYAEDMLQRGFYGHFSPEGEDVGDRVHKARFAYRKAGENVASGQPTIDAVMDAWVHSPEHYENLIDPEYQLIGIGFAAGPTRDGSYRFLWVQVFAQPRR